MDKDLRIIISGGGTGGHIFPAISIDDIKKDVVGTSNIFVVNLALSAGCKKLRFFIISLTIS